MRVFYSSILYLLTPFVLARLLWRGIKAPAYWRRWSERFAFYHHSHRQGVVWFHAVSVGEAESLFPLVRLLLEKRPDSKVLVTTTTPTGSSRVKAVLEEKVEHVYLPYDLPGAVQRFMEHFRPVMAVIMETEIWPNLFSQCRKNNIPLMIANARLSDKSFRRYQKIPSLVHFCLARVNSIAAQTTEDAARFIALGARENGVSVTGNIKFDLDIPEEIRAQGALLKATVFPGRLVWIVASTHRGEDEIFLSCYRQLKQVFPQLLLMLVPRHPERFSEVKNLALREHFRVLLRTEGKPCQQQTDVYVADTMGELKMLYAAADLAFVAGSMVPVGGHNVLEPAALAVPVMFGPHMHNFRDIAKGLLAADAAVQCRDAAELLEQTQVLLGDARQRKRLAVHGQAFVLNNQGALQRVYNKISQNLDDD